MDVPYPSEAVRNARVPISHAHKQYGRLPTYYWYTSKLLTFQRSNKSQTRNSICHPILRLRSDALFLSVFTLSEAQRYIILCFPL